MIEIGPIHTLNARGNLMLEVMRDYFKIGPESMQREIQGMRLKLEKDLSKKGIPYAKLKSALVPDRKRREIALIFDTLSIESGCYGYEIFEKIIPFLEMKSNHSILCGDYLDIPGKTEELILAFEESVRLRRSIEFRHPTQFFIVYLSNLTEAMVSAMDAGLSSYEPYVGYADTTFASKFKIYLSTMLVNICVKYGSIIIQGHEPDRDEDEDVNMCSYPFEEFGYKCRSINADLAGLLLSYKIERPVLPGFEVDTEFSLNAISTSPLPLYDFDIDVQEEKLRYIKENKTGSVERAGLAEVTADDLKSIIKEKIYANYIYNMQFLHDHNVMKFNIILEIPSIHGEKTRILAALEYIPAQKRLRLLTFF